MNAGQLLRPRQANKPFLLEASPNSIAKETACTSSQLKSARPTKGPVQKIKSHRRPSPTIEANSQPLSSSSKAAGFARFLQEHSSPQHQRVTAGGRIVPVKCIKMSSHSDEQIPSQAQNVAGKAMEEPSANTSHPGGAQYGPATAQNAQFPFIVGGSQQSDGPHDPPPGFPTMPAGNGTIPVSSLFTFLPERNLIWFNWPTYPFPGQTMAESGGLVLPVPASAAQVNENALEVLTNMFRFLPGHCVVPLADVKTVLQTLYLSLFHIWYADRWMAIQGAMKGLIDMCDTTLDLVNAAAASTDQTESFHVSLRYYYINLRMLFLAFYEYLTDELQRRMDLPPTVPQGHTGAFGSEAFSSGDMSAETVINVGNRVPLPDWLSAPYHFEGPLFVDDHDIEEKPLPGSPSPANENSATIDHDKDTMLQGLGALSMHDKGSTAEGATGLNPEAPAWNEVAAPDSVVEGVEPLEDGHLHGDKPHESALFGQWDGTSGRVPLGLRARFARQISRTPSGHSGSGSSDNQPLLPADEVVDDTDGRSVLSPTTSVSSGSSGLAEGESVAAGLRIDEPEVMSRGAGETESISQSVRDVLGPMPPKGEAIGVENSLSAVDEGRQASEGDGTVRTIQGGRTLPGAGMHHESRRPNQYVLTIKRSSSV